MADKVLVTSRFPSAMLARFAARFRFAVADETLAILEEGIYTELARLAGDPAAYERQSMAALDEYRSRFDPVDAGKRLRAIYDQALLA